MPRKGDATRQRIIEGAAHLIRRKGFSSTSINELSQAASVQKSSLYFHFPGKDELGIAVLERLRQVTLKLFHGTLQGSCPVKSLEHFFQSVIEAHRCSHFQGGCIFGNTALEMADRNERYSGLVDEVFREMAACVETCLTRGQQLGQVRQDIPAHTLAQHVVVVLEGAIMLARLRKDEEPLRSSFSTLGTMLKVSP